MKNILWVGMALIAAGFGAHAQTIYKCVGKDGKTTFSNDPCPGSKVIQASPPAEKGAEVKKESSARPAAAGKSDIPEMHAGKWKMRMVRENGGSPSEIETCGDPIAGFRKEVQAYAANTKSGCTLETTALGPRSVRVVYDCTSERLPQGRKGQKGRSEMTLVSASPAAFRIESKSTVKPRRVTEGIRIGECKK